MFRSKALEHGKAMLAATASAWCCPCWDCRAHRRQVLKLAAIAVLLLGGSGGAAYEIYELGRRHLSAARPAAGALEVVAAAAATAPLVPGAWDT